MQMNCLRLTSPNRSINSVGIWLSDDPVVRFYAYLAKNRTYFQVFSFLLQTPDAPSSQNMFVPLLLRAVVLTRFAFLFTFSTHSHCNTLQIKRPLNSFCWICFCAVNLNWSGPPWELPWTPATICELELQCFFDVNIWPVSSYCTFFATLRAEVWFKLADLVFSFEEAYAKSIIEHIMRLYENLSVRSSL